MYTPYLRPPNSVAYSIPALSEIPTICYLDICSVSHLKSWLKTFSPTTRIIESTIQELRSIDVKGNRISYLPATLEKASNKTSWTKHADFVEELRRDLDAIQSFCTRANLVENWAYLVEASSAFFHQDIELDTQRYLAFLNFSCSQQLHNRIAEKDRLALTTLLVEKARELEVQASHPCVLVTIACVYDCDAARGVMKFKGNPAKYDAQNRLNDIQMIARVKGMMDGMVGSVAREGGTRYATRFISGDEALPKLLEIFTSRGSTTTEGISSVATAYRMSVDGPRLFPGLFGTDGNIKDYRSQQELVQVFKLIGAT